jgi:hypothetical protein
VADALADAKLGTAAACLVADFDGDGLPDIVQPFTGGGLLYKGTSVGSFAPPVPIEGVGGGTAALKAVTGDYDADGLLDVFLTSKSGCRLWHNQGGGTFRETITDAGETAYIPKPNASDCGTCDINNDGRQDVLILYEKAMNPQVFFNRGFRCFGYAVSLDFEHTRILPEAGAGQQAGLVTDLNGDGAQDLALVLAGGEVWVILRAVEVPPLGVELTVRPAAGPVRATGWAEERCLGAWNVPPGRGGTLVGLPFPGPCGLTWQYPGAALKEKQVAVESNVIRQELP